MTRPRKNIVDYFPHSCTHGKTIFILEQRFGNDGYAFWFKLLELIGSSENHVIDAGNPATWEFLLSKTRVTSETGAEILDLLSKLDAIDPELWADRIIWSSNFVSNLRDVYRKRSSEIPLKPDIRRRKPDDIGVLDVENPQSKVKESKVNKSKLEKTLVRQVGREGMNGNGFDIFWLNYPKKEGKGACRKIWEKLRPSGELVDRMIQAIQNQKQSKKWLEQGGRFIPMPATWLNQGRWDDEIGDGMPFEGADRIRNVMLPIPGGDDENF